jgi:hypothetical protein
MSTDKPKKLNVNLSVKRFEKLKRYAAHCERQMTQLVQDWIDSLPDIELKN